MNTWDRYRDKRIVYQAGLRATQYGAPGFFTLDEWVDLCERHNHACANCGAQVPLTADHIIPFVRGGTNHIGNIQPLCKSCNSRKGYKLPDGFVAPVQGLVPRMKITWEKPPLPLIEQLRRLRSHPRHRLIIDVDKARKLEVLSQQIDVTIEDFVENLIEQAWDSAVQDDIA